MNIKKYIIIALILLYPSTLHAQLRATEVSGIDNGILINQLIPKSFNTNLSNTKGAIEGIKLNNVVSKNKFPFPEFLESATGGREGVKLSQFFGENENEIVTIIGKEIIFLREVFYALTLNILEYLNIFVDRRDALENHITYLKTLEQLQSEKIVRINNRVAALQIRVDEDETSLAQLENQFFQDFEKFKAKEAEDNLGDFIDASQKATGTKAYLGALKKVQEFHTILFPQLAKRITAIEVNKEALIQGIRVTEIEDVDLGLILR